MMSDVWERLSASVFGFFLIGRGVMGFEGVMKWVLEHPVSQYMGRISYGLYLYHNFVFNVYHTRPTHFTVQSWNWMTRQLPVLDRLLLFSVLLLPFPNYSAGYRLSWYLIEKTD